MLDVKVFVCDGYLAGWSNEYFSVSEVLGSVDLGDRVRGLEGEG